MVRFILEHEVSRHARVYDLADRLVIPRITLWRTSRKRQSARLFSDSKLSFIPEYAVSRHTRVYDLCEPLRLSRDSRRASEGSY